MSPSSPKPVVPKTYKEHPFDLHGLDGISDAQIAEHLVLYAGYVKQVNGINEQLAEMIGRGQAPGTHPELATLTHRLGFEYNGMLLHEHYFSGLRSQAEPHPPSGSALAAALAESFGSVGQWQAAFHAVGESRGVGWVILFQDPTTHWLTNHWISLHQEGVPAGFTPLLVMDVWEHAFMRDYKATERGAYIEAFFRNIDWRMIEQRLLTTRALRLAS